LIVIQVVITKTEWYWLRFESTSIVKTLQVNSRFSMLTRKIGTYFTSTELQIKKQDG